jgi:Fe-S cluster assembly iron-binding protein IscA
MLTLTDRAAALLAEMLEKEKNPPGVAVRLAEDPEEGLTFSLDRKHPGDEAIRYKRRTVLLLERALAERLKDDTLDVERGRGGLELALRGGPRRKDEEDEDEELEEEDDDEDEELEEDDDEADEEPEGEDDDEADEELTEDDSEDYRDLEEEERL